MLRLLLQIGVTVTFLANEGVLLAAGNTKVLIDGLFLRYGPEFALPADSTQRTLHAARSPFDGIDVLLVTHRHGDHFHPVPHTGGFRNRQLEHLGFLVEIGGRRVLHLGDGDISERTLRPLRLDTMRVDIALVPSWVVGSADGAAVLRKFVRARQVVAFHLPEHAPPEIARDVARHFPGALVFSRSLESHRW